MSQQCSKVTRFGKILQAFKVKFHNHSNLNAISLQHSTKIYYFHKKPQTIYIYFFIYNINNFLTRTLNRYFYDGVPEIKIIMFECVAKPQSIAPKNLHPNKSFRIRQQQITNKYSCNPFRIHF